MVAPVSLDDYNLEIYFEAKPRVRLLTVGEVLVMSKDFVQIADDVISGVSRYARVRQI